MKNNIWIAFKMDALLIYGAPKSSTVYLYRMSHRVPSAFKLVYGHLNSIFLTGNFAWAFAIPFANSGQKDFADF